MARRAGQKREASKVANELVQMVQSVVDGLPARLTCHIIERENRIWAQLCMPAAHIRFAGAHIYFVTCLARMAGKSGKKHAQKSIRPIEKHQDAHLDIMFRTCPESFSAAHAARSQSGEHNKGLGFRV